MPLVWAHAEHIKLLRSLRDGAVFDRPPQTVRRYLVEGTGLPAAGASTTNARRSRRAGRCASSSWPRARPLEQRRLGDARDMSTRDNGLGIHLADLTGELPSGSTIEFTFYWPRAGRWGEGGLPGGRGMTGDRIPPVMATGSRSCRLVLPGTRAGGTSAARAIPPLQDDCATGRYRLEEVATQPALLPGSAHTLRPPIGFLDDRPIGKVEEQSPACGGVAGWQPLGGELVDIASPPWWRPGR